MPGADGHIFNALFAPIPTVSAAVGLSAPTSNVGQVILAFPTIPLSWMMGTTSSCWGRSKTLLMRLLGYLAPNQQSRCPIGRRSTPMLLYIQK